jgi:uncharacterized protein YbaP (TraB family)
MHKIACFCLVLLSTFAHAEKSVCEAPLVLTRPFAYRLQKSNKISYLLGTRHQGIPLTALPTKVLEHLDQSSDVYTEVKPSRKSDSEYNRQLLDQAQLGPQGKPASELLLFYSWLRLRDLFLAKGFSEQVIERLPLATVWFLLNVNLDEPTTGRMDQELLARAQKNGSRIAGLEIQMVQTRLFVKNLTVGGIEREIARRTKDSLNPTEDPYLTGDEDRLRENIVRTKKEEPKHYYNAIKARNRRWLPQIIQAHETSRQAFFAVGASHLLGPDGVLTLLKQQGFTVERLEDIIDGQHADFF